MKKTFSRAWLIVACLFCATVQATEVEFTVHHGVGGPSDKTTRLIAQKLQQKYVVVNRPGAQGKIAVRQLLSTNSMMIATMPQIFVTNFLMTGDAGYKEDDLELLAVVGVMPNVLVCNNKLGFKTVKDFLNSKKSLNFGVAGYGSSEHLATETLLKQFNNSHVVIPYAQGGASSLTDLLSGNLDCMFANYPLVKEHVADPNSRLTALISSHNLGLKIPNWSSEFKESFPFQSHLGLVVDKNMDAALKRVIVADMSKVFESESFKSDLRKMGLFPIASTNKKVIDESLQNNLKTRALIVKYNFKLN